ncbi:MAG: hypothetical protein ACI92E_000734, partial [Oceanicoccus sp.]
NKMPIGRTVWNEKKRARIRKTMQNNTAKP